MRRFMSHRNIHDLHLLWKKIHALTGCRVILHKLTSASDFHCAQTVLNPPARTRSISSHCCPLNSSCVFSHSHPVNQLTRIQCVVHSRHKHLSFSQQRTLFSGCGTAYARRLPVPPHVPGCGRSVTKQQNGDRSRVTPSACLSMATQSPSQGVSLKVPELSPEDQEMRKNLHEIFLTAVEAVMPKSLLEKVIHFNPNINTLTVKDRSYVVQRNVFVVGFGKGVLGMARVVEDLLGEHIIRGILSVPTGAKDDYEKAGKQDMMLKEGSKICVQEGAANNLPDSNAFRTARDIHKLVSNLTNKDIVIVLMSGGGSALLPYPKEPLDLEDVVTATKELFNRGATISDVNTLRRHLEVLKGGGLASAAMPAQVISLILSDVIGDSLEMIASGPTVRQTYSPLRCLEVIDRLSARDAMPAKVLKLLEDGKILQMAQSQLTADPRGGMTQGAPADKTDWSRVQNVLIGSNSVGCGAAASCAEQLGFITCILTYSLSGEARMAGQLLANLAQYVSACYQAGGRTGDKELVRLELDMAAQGIAKDKLNEISSKATKAYNSKKPICLVAGGESVVNIKGTGKGGRNQEMVLAVGIHFQKAFQVCRDRRSRASVFFLSAGTDGQDGPTDAAGAVVDENFMVDAASQGLNPEEFLGNNDSYNLWQQFAGARDHMVTGLTGTNVMDIHLLVLTGP